MTLAFRGDVEKERGWGNEKTYLLYGLEEKELKKEVSADYSITATEIDVIAKFLIDQLDGFLHYTSGSIPDAATTFKTKYDNIELAEALDELADRIDGVWSVESDGLVNLKKIIALDTTTVPDPGGRGLSNTDSPITSPTYVLLNETFNYIHLYGKGYLESDGDSEDVESILINGKIELVRYYPGCNDLQQLKNIAAALLIKDGIATPPIDVEFIWRNSGFLPVARNFKFTFDFIDRLSTTTTYVFKGISLREDDSANILLTNSTFQKGREYD